MVIKSYIHKVSLQPIFLNENRLKQKDADNCTKHNMEMPLYDHTIAKEGYSKICYF